MSFSRSVCEEFCDSVEEEVDPLTKLVELKCTLGIIHFTPLMERLNELGYACTHVQRDPRNKKCFAWFEEMSLN